jgi:PAS domain S-box-containing protein
MIGKKNSSGKASELRRRAERKAAQSPEIIDAMLSEEVKRVLHELRVHQIELEMQNEELRTSQVEFEAARARYFDLYNLAPVGYFTISEQGLILEANLTAAVMLDVHLGALLGRPFSQFILKTDQDIYYLHRKQLLESGEMRAFELRILKQDGSPFWAQLDATVTEIDDGASVIRVVISDISERKHAEDALKDNREIFAGIPDGVIVHDDQGVILDNNDVTARRLEMPRELLVGRKIEEFISPDNAAVIGDNIANAQKGQMLLFEAIYVSASGKAIPSEVHACRIPWRGGQAVLSISRDITERKQAEADMKESLLFRREAEKIGRIGAWKVSPETNYLYWTEGVYEIIEAPADYMPGLEEGLEFYDAESIPVLQESLRRALVDKTPFVIESGLTTMTGKHLWVEVRGLLGWMMKSNPTSWEQYRTSPGANRRRRSCRGAKASIAPFLRLPISP